jgi:DNA-binding transcriptional regulator GbsR (MarR family)
MSKQRTETYQKASDQFVRLWGEMASAWGINKTMAQIHALLYAERDPLNTDMIMKALGVSRGNVNMNLRSLMQWQLIEKVSIEGNRKDFYTAEKDVWNIVAVLIEERQQREIAPIHKSLEECLEMFEREGGIGDDEQKNEEQKLEEQEFKERIENFLEFLIMFDRFTKAMIPYINRKNLGFLKKLVKIAEAHQNLKEAVSGVVGGGKSVGGGSNSGEGGGSNFGEGSNSGEGSGSNSGEGSNSGGDQSA